MRVIQTKKRKTSSKKLNGFYTKKDEKKALDLFEKLISKGMSTKEALDKCKEKFNKENNT